MFSLFLLLIGSFNFVSAAEPVCSDFGYDYGLVGEPCIDGDQEYDLSGCYNEDQTCTDNDDGLDYFTASNIILSFSTIYGPSCEGSGGGGGGTGVYNDECNGNILTEYTCDGNQETSMDYECLNECVEGACVEETQPECSVDFLQHKYNENEYFFSDSIYINENGFFYVYGKASDTESNIINVQYNRESPDTYHIFSGADSVDGAFNELVEEWRSDKDDLAYIDGWHEICCRATDQLNNVGEGTCQEFCIDTEEPGQVINIIHSNPSECVANYVNEAPSFSWDVLEDEGCAGIDYYEVEVYYSDGTLYYTTTTKENSIIINAPENGQDYYIRVKAWDMAGNSGDWSEYSEHVYYDNNEPTITITGEPWDEWYNDDFYVYETDEDAEGNLWKCEIAITGDESSPEDYTEIECNAELGDLIDISEVCPDDGENICWVRKRVTDKACNQNMKGHQWDLDREAPLTEKIISEPKYPGFEWMQWFIDWFITDNTEIELSCSDSDSGCDITYYRVNNGNWIEYEGVISFDIDGVYELEYFSVDNVGNSEDVQYEIDKVDTMSPVTIKEIGEPTYNDGEKLWVNCKTEFTLTCTDTEVGCAETYYVAECADEEIQYEPILYENPFNLEGLEDCSWTELNWQSFDLLNNEEEWNSQIDWIDCEGPEITIHNPLPWETEIKRCSQSIVATIIDEKTGIKEVWAELLNDQEEKVREVGLTQSIYGTWEALMNKELPVGDYLLRVCATDNLDNENCEEIEEELVETVFVEYISPALCNIDPESGGECDFTFHVCMRGENSVQFWMNKLGNIITPAMMNTVITNNEDEAFVGLKHCEEYDEDECISWFETEAGVLQLDCEEINQQTQFNLHLELDSEVVTQIGPGVHDLEYWIESLWQECEEPIVYDCEEGETRTCYTGPTGTGEIGECSAGIESCEYGFWSGICEDEVLPTIEICDDELDNDCDGYIDFEDFDDCYPD